MHTTAADWFDAGSSRRRKVTLRVQGEDLLVYENDGDTLLRRLPLAQVTLSTRLAAVPQQLHLPDGVMMNVAAHDFIDAAFASHRAPLRWVTTAERKWHWLLLLLLFGATLLTASYRLGLPWAAEQLAAHIPPQYARSVSAEIYNQLRAENILRASTLSPAQTARAERVFAEVAPPDVYLKIHRFFYYGDEALANAFAFPDGMILLTDEIIKLLDDDELHAVLAHEVGHVRHRHGLRLMVQAIGVYAVVFFITGDFAGMSLLPIALANAHYSRDFEREADCYAAAHLHARGKSPTLIPAALYKLEEGNAAERIRVREEFLYADEDPADSAEEAKQRGKIRAEVREHGEEMEEDLATLGKLLQVFSTHPETEERNNLTQACNL